MAPTAITVTRVQSCAVLDLEQQLALETRPWFADAVRIRRWDDEAKVADAVTRRIPADDRAVAGAAVVALGTGHRLR
jgi:predicted HD phosphohydrolase